MKTRPAADGTIRRRLLIWGAAAAILIVAVVVAQRIRTGSLHFRSAVIAEPWDRLDGAAWLRPNLRDARVVIPARPLSRYEDQLPPEVRTAKVKRTTTFTVNTNSQRLRGGALGEKPPGGIRILVLGDSITFGWGVDDDDAWPVQLERLLSSQGHQVQVINAGMPGGFAEVLQLFCQRIGPEYEPDLVVWTRRPQGSELPPYGSYLERISACREALGVPMLLALTPFGTFDWAYSLAPQEAAALQTACDEILLPMVEPTPLFDLISHGRGFALLRQDGEYRLVNQATGEELQRTPIHRPGGQAAPGERLGESANGGGQPPPPPPDDDAPIGPQADLQRGESWEPPPELPWEFYALLEEDHSISEPLFVDGSHLSAEGGQVMAQAVAQALEPLLAEHQRRP
mgnify:CR=1 FL=1